MEELLEVSFYIRYNVFIAANLAGENRKLFSILLPFQCKDSPSKAIA